MLLPIILAALLAQAGPDEVAKPRGISPIVGEDVAAVIHVHLTRFDAEAMTRKVAGAVADEAEVALIARRFQDRVDALKGAGAKDIFLLLSLADMPGPPALAVPIPPGADGGKIAEVLKGGLPGMPAGSLAAEEIRGVAVAGSPATLARIRGAKPIRRPDLSAALASVGDSPLQVGIAPDRTLRRAIAESMPTLPPSLGGQPTETLTRGVAWASLGVAGGRDEDTLRVVVHATDPSASGAIGAIILTALAGFAASAEADPAQADLARAIRRVRPEVGGDDVRLETKVEEAFAIVAPPIRRFREATRRSGCVNNLKQIGLAMHNYHSTHNTFPPAFSTGKDGKPLLSWRVHILPFLEARELYNEFDLDEAWDGPHNKALIPRMPAIYACPSMTRALVVQGKTTYLTPRGPGTSFPGGKGVKIQEIPDGSSNTILVVDANDGVAVTWTRPDDWEVAPTLDPRSLFGHHADRTLVGFADGSVRTLKATVPLRVWQAFTTRDGGEVLDPGEH